MTTFWPHWSNAGLNLVSDLFSDSLPLPFSALQSRYGLHSIDFYKFLKIKALLSLRSIKPIVPSLPSKLYQFVRSGHAVSKIYKLLTPNPSKAHKNCETKWESEINTSNILFNWAKLHITPFTNKTSPVLSQS